MNVPSNAPAIAAIMQGNQALGSGIQSGLTALGGAIGQRREHQQMLKEMQDKEDKQRAREFNALVALGETSGLWTKDQAMTKSLEELKGTFEATVLKRKQEEEATRLALLKEQLGGIQQMQQGMRAGLTALSDQPPFANAGQPLDVRAMRAIAASGMAAPQMANIVGDLTKMQQSLAGKNKMPAVFDFGNGRSGIYSPDTGQFLRDPVQPDPNLLRQSDKISLGRQRIELIKAKAMATDEDRALIEDELRAIDEQLGRTPRPPLSAAANPGGKTKAGNSFRVVGGGVDLSGGEPDAAAPAKPTKPAGPALTGITALDNEIKSGYQKSQEGVRRQIAELDAQIEEAAKPRSTYVSAGIGARPTQAVVSAEERAREVRRLQARRKALEAQLAE